VGRALVVALAVVGVGVLAPSWPVLGVAAVVWYVAAAAVEYGLCGGERWWQRAVSRVCEASWWPVEAVIEAVAVVLLLWTRPLTRADVASLQWAWELSPRRVRRQLSRAPISTVQYIASQHTPVGFSLAVVERITAEEWSSTLEWAAWDALGTCHDAAALGEGINQVLAWVPPERLARSGESAAVELSTNPCLTLEHVALVHHNADDALGEMLRLVHERQGRDVLFDELGARREVAAEVVRFAQATSRWPGDGAMPFRQLLAVLRANPQPGFATVLAAVLGEEHAHGRECSLEAALVQVRAVRELETVGRLLEAGAAGSVAELDAIAGAS
jgi:hypothetical protein